jgi:metallo-beta-lactamase family protein
MKIIHHGGAKGVTGSCHELVIDREHSVLIDCGLFQGNDVSQARTGTKQLKIDFPIEHLEALIVTHCHIDHVGRLPYLLMAGFDKKIICSVATAQLIPLVLEDALKMGFTRDAKLIASFLRKVEGLLMPLPYGKWVALAGCKIRLQPAGHILGSAFVEIQTGSGLQKHTTVFSGDLGAPHTPLLPAPKSPYRADTLVLESTNGDKTHPGRKERVQTLQTRIESCFKNRGTFLIPAFSIGRTQELLYEIEQIIHRQGKRLAVQGIAWEDLDIIVDSPLVNKFSEVYKTLASCWAGEAKRRVQRGRHPLSFEQLLTINDHQEHLRTIDYLKQSGRPAIVIAASGMCSGGRIANYLKALIADPRTDILFVGYPAKGTIGRKIQKYGPQNGYVQMDNKKYTIAAGEETISGYSAHAGQDNLLRFIKGIRKKPSLIRLVHGEPYAQKALQEKIGTAFPEITVERGSELKGELL